MKASRSKRWIFEAVAFVLLALYFCSNALPKAWRTLNTDFPNYYVAARLAREGVDASRAYEWAWIERTKDHWSIDQRVIGLVPITPFSTLVVLPLAELDPLRAKQIWIAINLLLMVAIIFLLASVSRLSILQAGLLIGLSYPLEKNLLFGQYYILLLAILAAGCWAAQRSRNRLAGALVGFAAALKIFPILLLFYFLRKKDWKAIVWCFLTVAACVGISVAVFGVGLHRTYLQQVLPWTLRGDCLPPFNLASNSLSSLLHCLFVYEPQWNPHPALNAAWLLPVLHSILQVALFAPAVLWIDPEDRRQERIAMEWSGLLLVALTISTLTASYHFTVLLLPVAVLCGYFARRREYSLLLLAIMLFLAIGYPGWPAGQHRGWTALLFVPRLYFSLALSIVAITVMRRGRVQTSTPGPFLWEAGFIVATLASILFGLRHQRGLFDDFAYRLPMQQDILLASQPGAHGDNDVAFIALTKSGYRATSIRGLPDTSATEPAGTDVDDLSLAVSGRDIWIEQVSSHSVIHLAGSSKSSIEDAESPAFSLAGKTIAFLRQVEGRRQVFIRTLLDPNLADRQLTTSPWNVSEMAFLNEESLVISATRDQSGPSLYLLNLKGEITPLGVDVARYPAVSPDGRWLAFSKLVDGNWNLFLRDLRGGTTARLTTAPCNQVESSWRPDSKTLLYATDCGRALWFTALARRQIIP